jgi:hypothetical protein
MQIIVRVEILTYITEVRRTVSASEPCTLDSCHTSVTKRSCVLQLLQIFYVSVSLYPQAVVDRSHRLDPMCYLILGGVQRGSYT